jgi:putative membrane protein
MRLLVLFVSLCLLLTACYNPRGWHMMEDWGHMLWWGYGGVFMWLIFLVIIGVVVYFIVRGEKWMKRGTDEETALDMLKKRYAKGEITKQEYDKIKKDLAS